MTYTYKNMPDTDDVLGGSEWIHCSFLELVYKIEWMQNGALEALNSNNYHIFHGWMYKNNKVWNFAKMVKKIGNLLECVNSIKISIKFGKNIYRM